MSVKRKIMSALTAAALAVTSMFSLTGCSDVSYALTIDGEAIPSGVYILYSGYALNNAQSKVMEEQPDLDTSKEDFSFYDQTVGGVKFADYVKQEAIRLCKRYVAVNRLYDELGIETDPVEEDDLNDNINSQWDYNVKGWDSTLPYLKGCDTLGEYYESIGVSKSSFKDVMTASYKASNIFKYYYGEGGKEEVPKSEIESYLKENYTLARYFGISLRDGENELIESKTELAVLEKLAEDYAKMLNDGDSYAEVYERYQKYLDDNKEDDSSTTTTTTTTAATTPADTDEDGIDAQNDEPEEEGTTTAGTEEEAPEESGEDTSETAGTEDSEPTEDTEETGDTSETEESTTAATTAADDKDEDEHEHDDSEYDRIISKEATSPSEEFVKALFEQKIGTADVFKADTYYYVVQRLDITENDEYVEDYTDIALDGLKGDDMDKVFEDMYANYTVTENTGAPDYAAQQCENASSALSTISMIQYYSQYYSSLLGGGY